MTRTIAILAACVLVSLAGHAQKKNVTIIGEVVDIVSYITSGTKPTSPEAKEILDMSVRGGNPLGILESGTGKLYVVTMKQPNTSANSALYPFVGIKVAASGDVYQKGNSSVLVMTVVGKSIK